MAEGQQMVDAAAAAGVALGVSHNRVFYAAMQASVTAYLEAVTAGQEPPVTGAVALETVRLLERIYDTAAIPPGRPSPG